MPAVPIRLLDVPTAGRELGSRDRAILEVDTSAQPLHFSEQVRVLVAVDLHGMERVWHGF
jgi:hypothetical protein